jgi:hypothetical protein
VTGLVGASGIAPAAPALTRIAGAVGLERLYLVPTLFWLDASDGAMRALCWSGVVLAVLLILDVAPALCLSLLWAAYLSLVTVGQDFLAFQWDGLLLETGFLAIFLAPWRLRPRLRQTSDPPALFRFLLWFLLFRLMFSSGVVKLLSGDPTWRDLTALTVHYETQPLPPWTAWFAHRLPAWFHRLSAAVMFGIELVVPFLIAAPRRWRHAGSVVLVAFQALIAATGNYAFFNLLTMALCLFLLDDAVLGRWVKWPRQDAGGSAHPPRALAWPVAALLGALGLVLLIGFADRRTLRTGPVPWAFSATAPLHLVNSYGLFAMMTTTRPEIVVQGSADGETWRDYAFPWKPGAPGRRPAFVAPHQPRLDWQMWFAALGDCQSSRWLPGLFRGLLEGSPPVLGLLAGDPFPEGPPRYVRALVRDYRFTDPDERARSGRWWKQGEPQLFCPAVSLE